MTATVVVGVALAVLAGAQVAALNRTPPLPSDQALAATKENFGFDRVERDLSVIFQLRNESDETLQVLELGEALPGLDLVDVVGAGSPFMFRQAGAGPDPLPAFSLPPQEVVVLTLTYRLKACGEVPSDPRPIPVSAAAGKARGTLRVPLPELPDDTEDAAEEDVLQWQVRMVRDLCG